MHRTSAPPQHFLFVTLQHVESWFYGHVGAELRRRGHRVTHVTYSRHAARRLRARGETATALVDRMAAIGELDAETDAARITAQYDVPTFRDIYRTDFVCDHRPEAWAVQRTVRHVRAMEALFDEVRPDVVVPEVGNETIRTAAHLVALDRDVPVLFLFYTIFPDPLRLYVNSMEGPIVPRDALRPLEPQERAELERFSAEYIARDRPIRDHRAIEVSSRRLRLVLRHFAVKALEDQENPYLRPAHWLAAEGRDALRARAVRGMYEPAPDGSRPYVYFPLHVVEDYKLKRVIPHCADQVALIEQVARALPHGYDLVVKEHPMSIGHNRIAMLRKLKRMRNVRLVGPHVGSQDLIARAAAVAVISSTVGLEALLHAKPVMTLGRPFYSGYGVTLDVHDFRDIRTAVPQLLDFRPDDERTAQFLHAAMRACLPGSPVLVDRSMGNAVALAGSLEAAMSPAVSLVP